MWPTILSILGTLAGGLFANDLGNKQGRSSEDYKNAFSDANSSINQQQEKADQYTGNAGYQNSLEQGAMGAGKIANQAVGTATSGARNAGMSKAQSAQMGLQSGNQAYANAFQGQQGIAQNMGQNAISAQQGVTSAKQGQAGQAASEKQSQYNRQADTYGRIASGAGDIVTKLADSF